MAGPFAHWEHTHRVEPDGPDACYLEDHIEYALPLGALGALLGSGLVRRRLRAPSRIDIASRPRMSRRTHASEDEE